MQSRSAEDGSAGNGITAPTADEVRAVLDAHRVPGHHSLGAVVSLARSPSAYRTSHAMEELDVEFADGSRQQLMFKNVGPDGLLASARAAKPHFLLDPRREIETYRSVLGPVSLGTPRLFAAVEEPDRPRYWLFLERVPGRELYQVGELEVWQAAAAWLARFHARFRRLGLPPARHLLRHDENSLARWMCRALEHVQLVPHWEPLRSAFTKLALEYPRVIERLLQSPQSVIHGEFYASNVLAAETPAGLRICPIDWEMTGIGPCLLDLAALVAGNWSERQREALLDAYAAGWPAEEFPWRSLDELYAATDVARLHLAVQWTGWSTDWRPPTDHAQDWACEALRIGAALGLSPGDFRWPA